MKKEAWISAKEAAEIISTNSGRTIIQQYVRELAQKGKIAYRPVDGRTNEYLRSDVEKVKVRIKKVADRKKAQAITEANTPVGNSTTEERPWYLPEKEEGAEQAEDKSEADAA
jgi:hypothetical protein